MKYKLNRIIPTIVLAVLLSISVIVLLLFYLGGDVDPSKSLKGLEELSQPVFTDLLMKYMYVLFGIAFVVTIASAVITFKMKLSANPKSAITVLIGFSSLALLMILTYALGSTTELTIPGFDGVQTAFDLKLSDMCLYSIYVLFGITIIVSALSFLSKRFS